MDQMSHPANSLKRRPIKLARHAYPQRRPPWLLTATCVLISVAMLVPLLYLALRALSVAPRLLDTILSPRTLGIIANSLLLVLLVTLISLVVALPLAWLTTRTDIPFRRFWLIATSLPLVFPSYVGSFALIAMMGPRGLVYQWLSPFGIEEIPSIYGLGGATWALTIFTYPYLLLSIRTGLRRIDPAIEEAARTLGLNAWQSFWKVTFPSLKPAMLSGAILVALYTLSDFGAVSMLRFNTFTRAIYLQYTTSLDRSQAALLALILAVIATCLLFSLEYFQHNSYARISSGVARKPTRIALGRWRIPAVLFCAFVATIALVAPTGVVTYWLIRGIVAGESLLPLWDAALGSVIAGSAAAVTCIVLALPIAYLVVRYPSRLTSLISQASYIGYGLPGIVVAISLVYLGANYAIWLYQTLAMLVFAYAVRFMPQAMGTVRTTLVQTGYRLEEASRNLGRGPWGTLRMILLPLLQPGIRAGAALVFLTTVKELPATLLLRPTGFDTLATEIWSATEEAFFARAAAPALLLLVISAFSIGLVLRQGDQGAS